MKYIIAIIFFVVIVGIFLLTYIWNNKTQAPDIGQEMPECGACKNINCGYNPERRKKETK